MVDFSNLNTLAASILVETWNKLGLTQAVLCPGSRSAPLTVACARQSGLDCVVSLDERSAAFLALGYAKRTRQPVALVCTSGTAAANFFPALIEAHYSQVPLLVLTGDRPPILRNCHAGQTIDQTKLYGDYAQWQTELALPEANLNYCHYLRQTAIQAWQRCFWPRLGIVHLNCPFGEPLAPIPDHSVNHLKVHLDPPNFYQHLAKIPQIFPVIKPTFRGFLPDFSKLGLILVGVMPGGETAEYLTTLLAIAKSLNWPILGDALSSVRNFDDGEAVIVTTYDFILRCSDGAQALIPEQVLQIGELPTSKELRSWLEKIKPLRYCLEFNGENLDPLHGQTVSLSCTVFEFFQGLKCQNNQPNAQQFSYSQTWQKRQKQTAAIIQAHLTNSPWIAPVLVAQLSELLPPQTSILVANSLPIRWLEFFWQANHHHHQIFVNRGANGIDGTLSTAMGIAHHNPSQTILLTGDLSLLHDSNGFLNQAQLQGNLTIILLNNQGGGIFEWLTIAAYEDVFEPYFATPQSVNFAQLCQTYGVHHELIPDLFSLKTALGQSSPTPIRVLELNGDRRLELQWLKALQEKVIRLDSSV